MSRRTARLNSQIQRLLAEGIGQLSDPRVATFTSITRVEISSDLTLATVSVSVMGAAPAQAKLTVAALEQARGRLRSILANGLTMRRVPDLRFRLDASLQGAFDTVQVIDQLREAESTEDTSEEVADEEEST